MRVCAGPSSESFTLLLAIDMPRLHELMASGVLTAVHVTPGATLEPGAALVDVRVDLSHAAAHDCPPVSWFRVILRERGVLRDFTAAEGDEIAPGTRMGLLASAPDDASILVPARAARLTTVGIVGPDVQW